MSKRPVPDPTEIKIVEHGRQFHDGAGDEVFYAIAIGRRPDIDALLVLGSGKNKAQAELRATYRFRRAWRSLESKSTVGKQSDVA